MLKRIALTIAAISLSALACGDDQKTMQNSQTADANRSPGESDANSGNNSMLDAGPSDTGEADDAGDLDSADPWSSCVPSTIGGECDHLCQTGCAPDEICSLIGNPALMSVCRPPGDQRLGDPCDATEPRCMVGSVCVIGQTGDETGTCHEYCRIGEGSPQCGERETCNQLSGSDTGVCEPTDFGTFSAGDPIPDIVDVLAEFDTHSYNITFDTAVVLSGRAEGTSSFSIKLSGPNGVFVDTEADPRPKVWSNVSLSPGTYRLAIRHLVPGSLGLDSSMNYTVVMSTEAP